MQMPGVCRGTSPVVWKRDTNPDMADPNRNQRHERHITLTEWQCGAILGFGITKTVSHEKKRFQKFPPTLLTVLLSS